MKYYLDTEFHEYKKKPLFGKPIDTIELISIGIVSEDSHFVKIHKPSDIMNIGVTNVKIFGDNNDSSNFKKWSVNLPYGNYYIKSQNKGEVTLTNNEKEYYAICKDFDLKAAWNNEWLRENVLISLHKDLCSMAGTYGKTYHWKLFELFTLKSMKNLLNWYGKTKEQIAEEIKEFVGYIDGGGILTKRRKDLGCVELCGKDDGRNLPVYNPTPEFYAYYADYDWLVFCWLFGRMIDLPNGFPMYCKDLKQTLDDKVLSVLKNPRYPFRTDATFKHGLDYIKNMTSYPKQTNEHNALADARWNKELYKFIKTI